MAKRFGERLDIERFNLDQLQDARNKIRTKLSQVETNSKFESVLQDDSYQKAKMFLDVINTAIEEKSHIQEKAVSQAQQKLMGQAYALKKGEMKASDASEEVKKLAKEMSLSDLKDFASTKHKDLPTKKTDESKQAMSGETSAKNKAALQKELKSLQGKDDAKSKARVKQIKKMLGESVLREGEEEKAQLIMAAKDMVDRITGWLEDTAEMQTESMLELSDSIRDELGSDVAEQFTGAVKPALEAMYNTLTDSREKVTGALGILTGEGAPPEQMGAEGGEEAPAEEPVEEPAGEGGDEFAASEPAAGGTEAEGREKRESVDYRNLSLLLAGQKKRLSDS